MMRTKQTLIKTGLALFAVATLALNVQAQNVQEGSVWAPAGTKVDGKLTEWNNTLQAYNKTTLLYYTLANDETNLYLAIRSTDQTNNTKITRSGITFALNTAGKKKDDGAFEITFPVVSATAMRNQFRQRGGGGQGGPGGGQPLDSTAIANMRASLLASAKELNIKGFKDIPDSVLSIYNEYGIKVAAGYDANGSFVYELAIPLKLMNIDPANTKELAYHLKVNGIQMGQRTDRGGDRGPGGDGGGDGGQGGDGGNRGGGGGNRGGGGGGGNRGGGGGGGFGGGGFGGRGGFGGGRGPGGMDMASLFSTTDFWAKYTLAKKAN